MFVALYLYVWVPHTLLRTLPIERIDDFVILCSLELDDQESFFSCSLSTSLIPLVRGRLCEEYNLWCKAGHWLLQQSDVSPLSIIVLRTVLSCLLLYELYPTANETAAFEFSPTLSDRGRSSIASSWSLMDSEHDSNLPSLRLSVKEDLWELTVLMRWKYSNAENQINCTKTKRALLQWDILWSQIDPEVTNCKTKRSVTSCCSISVLIRQPVASEQRCR